MNHLVKLITNDDGDETLDDSWHLVDPTMEQGPAVFCTAEFFGLGESSCTYEEKSVSKGGITCPHCLKKLRILKSVKL